MGCEDLCEGWQLMGEVLATMGDTGLLFEALVGVDSLGNHFECSGWQAE